MIPSGDGLVNVTYEITEDEEAERFDADHLFAERPAEDEGRPDPIIPSTPAIPSTPPAIPSTPSDYKFGIPVPERPGMIRSPHNPDAGLIDARGLKPGTKIRCPFTSKVIKVP